ncbi:LysR family transcriptional regulator [Sphingobium xenophagum]
MRTLAKYFDELNSLRVIVEEGSISRAARRIPITQSALTRTVARLEAGLGVKLLIRSAKGVTPTQYARAMMSHLRAIDHELRSASMKLEALLTAANTRIRCGATRTPLMQVVPEAVDLLQRSRPGISISVQESIPPRLLAGLRLGEYDIVICVKETDDIDPEIAEQYLFTQDYGIYARSGHEVFNEGHLSLADVSQNYEWIYPIPGHWAHRALSESFIANEARVPVAKIETQSQHATGWWLEHTDRLAISTPSMIAKEVAEGKVRLVEGRWQLPEMPIYMYYSLRSEASNGLKAFMKHLREASVGAVAR